MLANAALFTTQLSEKFGELYYSDKLFYFSGGVKYNIPDFTPEPFKYKYAVVDKKGNLSGYIQYEIDTTSNSVQYVNVINFKDRSKLVYDDFKKLFKSFISEQGIRRIMLGIVAGDPMTKTCEELFDIYEGYMDEARCAIQSYRFTLHEWIADSHGELHDGEIYEYLIRR